MTATRTTLLSTDNCPRSVRAMSVLGWKPLSTLRTLARTIVRGRRRGAGEDGPWGVYYTPPVLSRLGCSPSDAIVNRCRPVQKISERTAKPFTIQSDNLVGGQCDPDRRVDATIGHGVRP